MEKYIKYKTKYLELKYKQLKHKQQIAGGKEEIQRLEAQLASITQILEELQKLSYLEKKELEELEKRKTQAIKRYHQLVTLLSVDDQQVTTAKEKITEHEIEIIANERKYYYNLNKLSALEIQSQLLTLELDEQRELEEDEGPEIRLQRTLINNAGKATQNAAAPGEEIVLAIKLVNEDEREHAADNGTFRRIMEKIRRVNDEFIRQKNEHMAKITQQEIDVWCTRFKAEYDIDNDYIWKDTRKIKPIDARLNELNEPDSLRTVIIRAKCDATIIIDKICKTTQGFIIYNLCLFDFIKIAPSVFSRKKSELTEIVLDQAGVREFRIECDPLYRLFFNYQHYLNTLMENLELEVDITNIIANEWLLFIIKLASEINVYKKLRMCLDYISREIAHDSANREHYFESGTPGFNDRINQIIIRSFINLIIFTKILPIIEILIEKLHNTSAEVLGQINTARVAEIAAQTKRLRRHHAYSTRAEQ